MLLGLLAAAMLATLLQLHAIRAKRPAAFEFASDGTICMRCWTVVESLPAPADRSWSAAQFALAAPVQRPEPLRFVGRMRMMPARPRPETPVRRRRIVYAGANRFHGFGEMPRMIPRDFLLDVLPPDAAWPAHSRPPPPLERASRAPAFSLH